MQRRGRGLAAVAACALLCLAAALPAAAVKLRISDVECVEKQIAEAESLVSVVLVAGESEEREVFFDFVVRTPQHTVAHSACARHRHPDGPERQVTRLCNG